jgi:nitrite reductase
MMPVRFGSGQAAPESLRVVGEVSRDFARSTADFTDRQNIRLHSIRIEDVSEIWRRLDTVGLTTMMGCGDVPRVILGSPTAWVAADELEERIGDIDSSLTISLNDYPNASARRRGLQAAT